ncbi:MAG: PIG-L family deacetylase [Spongiibacteraceae bacterium]|nr:PIG-L family deacetylase [Spongiibacteraceae bacterium]
MGKKILRNSIVLFFVITFSATAMADKKKHLPHIIAILAHPDDEAWLSGTAALIASKHPNFTVIYATSGDAGHDVSGMGLSGKKLAQEREKEAQRALTALGVAKPAVFLRLPDSKLTIEANTNLLRSTLKTVIEQHQANIILTFGEDGITAHSDHIMVGKITREVADHSPSVQTVLNVALSESRAAAMNRHAQEQGLDLASMVNLNPIADSAIDYRVNVARYNTNRTAAFSQHHTQFPVPLMALWNIFVPNEPIEEMVVSRKHKKQDKYLKTLLSH